MDNRQSLTRSLTHGTLSSLVAQALWNGVPTMTAIIAGFIPHLKGIPIWLDIPIGSVVFLLLVITLTRIDEWRMKRRQRLAPPSAALEQAGWQREPLQPQFEVLYAAYGAGDEWHECTSTLQGKIVKGRLKIYGGYGDSLGFDPMPGIPKKLKIIYVYNCRGGYVTYPEDVPVTLP